MPYVTKQAVREAARRDPLRSRVTVGTTGSLAEAVLAKRALETAPADRFDVFLSHSHQDAEFVEGAALLLEERGVKVYVDWIVDRDASRRQTTPEHARMVRARMRQSASLLYLCTDNSIGSRWTPWELGYFDAYKGAVAILPLLDTENGTFTGSEYLGLYPVVKLESVREFELKKVLGATQSTSPRILVEGAGVSLKELRDWTEQTARSNR